MKFLKWNGICARHSNPPSRLDLRQQLQLVEIAIHVVEGGDAVAGAPLQAALDDGEIMRVFLRRGLGIRLAAGRQSQPLADFAGQTDCTGPIASPSRNSPSASPSSPMTISLPGPSVLPLISPACSSAMVFAQAV